MQGELAPDSDFWRALLGAAAVGGTIVFAMAMAVDRLGQSAHWKRAAWRAATLGWCLLAAVQWTGMGDALHRLFQAPLKARADVAECVSGSEATARPREAPHGPAPNGLADPWEAVVPPVVTGPPEFLFEGGFPSERLVFGIERARPENIGRPSNTPPDFAPPPIHVSPVEAQAAVGVGVRDVELAASPGSWRPGLVWILGALLVAVRFLTSRLLLWAFVRRCDVLKDGVLKGAVDDVARQLGMSRPTRLLQAGAVARLSSPAAFGWLRPTIVLPADFAEQYSAREQRAILAHEIAHLSAADSLWQLVSDLVTAVFWWHPLAWWTRRRLHAAGELVADQASRLVPGGPDALAHCLVALGGRLARRRRLAWLGVEGPPLRSEMGRRVERLWRLADGPPGAGAPGALARLTFPAAFALAAVSCTAWIPGQAVLTERGKPMNVFATSWRNSLAAMALGALVTTAPNPAAAQDRDPPPRERERSERGVRDDDNPARPAASERGRRDREAARQVGDRPGPREQGMREQRELEELSRRLRAELNQLGDDQAEEAEEIELRLRDIKEKIEVMEHRRQDEAARDRPDRPASDLAPRRELDRLEDRADDLRRDLASARREASSPERKESLERELQAIQGRIAEIRRRFGGDRPGPRRSVLDPLRDDRGAGPAVESYLAAVRRLRQFASPEEGQRLAQQAMEIARRLRHRPDPPRLAETPRYPQPPRPQIAPPRDGAADQLRGQLEGRVREALEEARGQTEEMRQQLDETRRAIEETRHGVLEEIHGQTAPVRREIDEMHGALEETHGRMAQMGRELDEQVHGAMEETHGQIERMNREITQMRGALEEARRQMEEMRRQMEEMRGAMHRMTQPPQRDPEPRDEDAPNPFQP